MKNIYNKLSKMRKCKLILFVGRLIIYIIVNILFVLSLFNNEFAEKQFEILNGFNFFKQFSIFHILWAIWMFSMFHQLIPLSNKTREMLKISKGSQKLFKKHFSKNSNANKLQIAYSIKKENKKALILLLIWSLFIFLINLTATILVKVGISKFLIKKCLFIICINFYIDDSICYLFWCPFKVFFMKNRCCLDCRIYNWDHMMMYTPMMLINSFFSLSLLFTGLIVMGVWELNILLHKERFLEISNNNLKCSNCTDLLCKKYGGIHAKNH